MVRQAGVENYTIFSFLFFFLLLLLFFSFSSLTILLFCFRRCVSGSSTHRASREEAESWAPAAFFVRLFVCLRVCAVLSIDTRRGTHMRPPVIGRHRLRGYYWKKKTISTLNLSSLSPKNVSQALNGLRSREVRPGVGLHGTDPGRLNS